MLTGCRRGDPVEGPYGTDEGFRWLAKTEQGKREGTEGVKVRKAEGKSWGPIGGLESKRLSVGHHTVVDCRRERDWYGLHYYF